MSAGTGDELTFDPYHKWLGIPSAEQPPNHREVGRRTMLFHVMSRACLRSGFTAALIFVPMGIATGGLVGEVSWKVASQDDLYLLVMVSPHPLDAGWSSPVLEAEIEIQKRYKQSGLYRNDESSELLWAIPYHIPVYEVYISPDGKHVVIANEYWDHTISNIPRGGVVFFYDKSGELASYQDYEITWCSMLKGLVNNLLGRNFLDCEEASFDSQALTYTIKTDQSEEFVFDITTGKIIRHRSPWFVYLGVPLFVVPIAVFVHYRTGSRSATNNDQRRSRVQFSLREALLLVTIICILLGLMSLNAILTVVCSVTAAVGGGIAWVCARSRRAWLIGIILSLYGGFVGLVFWARVVDFFLSPLSGPDPDFLVSYGTLTAFVAIGVVAGGLLAGWLERRRNYGRPAA